MQWNKTYGGTGDEDAESVIQTSDGGYAMAGYTTTYGNENIDFWLVKTDSAGNLQWNQTYGEAAYNGASSLIQTSDGGYAVAGEESSSGTMSGNTWLVKTDSAGNLQWSQTYGGAGPNSVSMIIQMPDGGYAMAGTKSGGYLWLIKTDGYGSIPELPSFILLPLSFTVTLLAVIVHKRKHTFSLVN